MQLKATQSGKQAPVKGTRQRPKLRQLSQAGWALSLESARSSAAPHVSVGLGTKAENDGYFLNGLKDGVLEGGVPAI